MVWFNDSSRIQLCETGVSCFKDIPMKTCHTPFCGSQFSIGVSFSDFTGLVEK